MNWSNGQSARNSRRRYINDATKQKQYFSQAKRRKVAESRNKKVNSEDFIPNYLKEGIETPDRRSCRASPHRESRRTILTLQDAKPPATQADLLPGIDDHSESAKRRQNVMEESDTSIDAKRRKLLQQSDWSGVELQKPVIVTYPEASRSSKQFQRHITQDHIQSPQKRMSKISLSTEMVIKIASQEYRWSPGNNSIKTCQSKTRNAKPETPIVARGSVYDIPSSASKSFSSLVPESPCAERTLQIRRGKAEQGQQLQSVSHTSPSTFDEPWVTALPATHCFHPQPLRRMPPNIFMRLSDAVGSEAMALNSGCASPVRPQSVATSRIAATESKSGESVVCDAIKTGSSIETSSTPKNKKEPTLPNRQSIFEHNLVLPPPARPARSDGVVQSEELPKFPESLPSNITAPDVYRVAEASHNRNRLSVFPYKTVVPAPDVCDEDENIMWKRFVLGSGHPGVAESAQRLGSDILNNEKNGSRSKLGIQTSALEPPTRIASRVENASPVPDTRRRQGSTPAPTGSTPPQTISAEGRLSNKPQATNDDEVPVHFREQKDGLEAMTAFPAEAEDASLSALAKMQHMTAKPESTFYPPSLFVGRLAASAAVAAVPDASEAVQDNPAPKAASARVMSRRRRNKRREAGRPDIRTLPNIQGDPIEFTP